MMKVRAIKAQTLLFNAVLLSAWQASCVSRKLGASGLRAQNAVKKYLDSPKYLNGYPSNVDCAWKIVAEEGHTIHVHVISMSLENSPGCSRDYVEILNSDGSQIDRMCAFKADGHYYSNDNSMFITFASDTGGSGMGFRLMYEAVMHASSVPKSASVGAIVLGLLVGVFVVCGCGICVALCVRRSRAAGRDGNGRRLVTTQNNRQPVRPAPVRVLNDSPMRPVDDMPIPAGNGSHFHSTSSPNDRSRDVQNRPAVSDRIEETFAAAFTEPGFPNIHWYRVVPNRLPDSSRDDDTPVPGSEMYLHDIDRPLHYSEYRVVPNPAPASDRVEAPPRPVASIETYLSGSRYGPRDVQNPPPSYSELNFHSNGRPRSGGCSNSENILMPTAPDFAEVREMVPITSSATEVSEVSELPPSYADAMLILRQQHPLSSASPLSSAVAGAETAS